MFALSCGPEPDITLCPGWDDKDALEQIDCDIPACAYYCDNDGDGARDLRFLEGSDCDDSNPSIHPDADEVCNGTDDDCDGLVDDLDPTIDDTTRIDAFIDEDRDGIGGPQIRVCQATAGLSAVGGDCDDTSAARFPGAIEICNGFDDDCDMAIDMEDEAGLLELDVLHWDADEDGYGDPGEATYGCSIPNWAPNPDDCNDLDAEIHPGAGEPCDGIDTDCDGMLGPDEADSDGDGDPTCTDCDDLDESRSSRFEERCNGIDDDCDGLVDTDDDTLNFYTCGPYCPDPDIIDVDAAPLYEETWNPCLLDPDTRSMCSNDPADPDTHTNGSRLHRVAWRTDEGHWRDELFLFLPPGPGQTNDRIRQWAAYAGYRTLSLGYPNDVPLATLCDGEFSDECYSSILYEITYGVDLSALIRVPSADSITTRLSVLLAHLASEHPEMGFERYLLDDGRPDWSRIAVTGWSGGGSWVGFIAHYERTAAALLMSAPWDHRTEVISPSSWIEAPSMTPGCAMLSTWHIDEPYGMPPYGLLPRAWDAMGLPATEFYVDENLGITPSSGTHRIAHSCDKTQLPQGCSFHASVGADDCLRDELLPSYLYLFCTLSELDSETCGD